MKEDKHNFFISLAKKFISYQKKIDKWDSKVVLHPMDISSLPEYISVNREKFKTWLE